MELVIIEQVFKVKVDTDYGIEVFHFAGDSISEAIKQGESLGVVLEAKFDHYQDIDPQSYC